MRGIRIANECPTSCERFIAEVYQLRGRRRQNGYQFSSRQEKMTGSPAPVITATPDRYLLLLQFGIPAHRAACPFDQIRCATRVGDTDRVSPSDHREKNWLQKPQNDTFRCITQVAVRRRSAECLCLFWTDSYPQIP